MKSIRLITIALPGAAVDDGTQVDRSGESEAFGKCVAALMK